MKLPGRVAILASIAVATTLLPSCSTRETTAPDPRHAVTGHVRLIGYRTAENGAFLGTEVVEDADGIVVELLYGKKVVATASTIDGNYRFEGIRPGGYVARARVLGILSDMTEDLTVANADLGVTDILTITSKGDLFPAPNPFTDVVEIIFDVPDTQWVDVRICSLSGATVRTLLSQDILPGQRFAWWYGHDQHGTLVPGERFWVTYESADGKRCQLLLR